MSHYPVVLSIHPYSSHVGRAPTPEDYTLFFVFVIDISDKCNRVKKDFTMGHNSRKTTQADV